MKIRPVILCGGAGTRLWPKKSKHQAKQFIDFGGCTLINKTFDISFDELTASIMLLKPYISMFLLIFKKKRRFLIQNLLLRY